MEAALKCPECGAPMMLRKSRFGQFYGCTRWPRCQASHGAHQRTGKPMGIPADKSTRQARILAHAAFDSIWKKGIMDRSEAYGWLAGKIGVERGECHISMMDLARCAKVTEICMKAAMEGRPGRREVQEHESVRVAG